MWAAAYTRIVIQTPQGGDLCPAVTLPEKAAGASDPPYGRLNILRMRRNAALDSTGSARRDVGIAPYKVRCGFAGDWQCNWRMLPGPPRAV